jgi:type IV pilus assembly protein PilM
MSRPRHGSGGGSPRPFASWLASPPPDAAIELSPERVSVATMGTRGSGLVVQGYATEPLPAGAIAPALTSHNIPDRAVVAAALRAALERIGVRPRRVALVVPDVVARVALLRFEKVPPRREDLDQLVRWQLRKAAPFPVEDACVSYSAGARTDEGQEFVVAAARRDIVEEYEGVCGAVGAYAGLVDLATLSVLNLFIASSSAPAGDWLVVHMRPDYTSLAIMRGEHVIFFRNRPEGDDDSLPDLVHQTAMYYQDRLSGQGFARVLLGGAGRVVGAVDVVRSSLEERLGVAVEPLDPTVGASLSDRILPTPDLGDILAPLVGMLLRSRREALVA